RRAFKNLERFVRPVPQPLCFESVDRQRTARQYIKVHSDDGQDVCLVPVAQHSTRELRARQKLFDQNRLPITIEQKGDLVAHLARGPAIVPLGDSLRRTLVQRLDEYRERE